MTADGEGAETEEFDAAELEVVRNKLESIAAEMGSVLIHGAFSPNITERRDCSTALFDAEGRMVGQAEHIPVHLGAMPEAVAAVRDCDAKPGDVFILNDPFQGGTHLPDVTLVAPVQGGDGLLGYTVSRAHHADVGGATPGSMPAGAESVFEEGVRIPPVRLVRDGRRNEDVEAMVLANVRNPAQRRADLRAQLAANEHGEQRLGQLADAYGHRLPAAFDAVIAYSRDRIESELQTIPDGTYRASDVMEGDGVTDDAIPIEVTVTIEDATVTVDFDGTAALVPGNVNAPRSVTNSAVYFTIRCVTDPDIPPNQGCYDPVTIRTPERSLLDPRPPAAVVGGNVETSQRITDVVFEALGKAAPERVPAGGQGTMNNVVIGSDDFAYYETIGGGAGATSEADGLSGVQVGMTNTLNTPIETLEQAYPIEVIEYAIRRGSGGAGRTDGGDGLIRRLRLTDAATVSLLTERRNTRPKGVAGGEPGESGRNLIDGEEVSAKLTRVVPAETTITIETPGGGGYGDPGEG